MTQPDPIVLRPSRLGAAALFFVSAMFTLGGAWMLASGATRGWFVGGFFGLCTVIALVNALPNASYLRLDSAGFEARSLFRSQRYAWHDIATFGVASVGVSTMVVLTFTQSYWRQHGHSARRFRLLGSGPGMPGMDGALPDTYGQAPADLASLLNDWKDGRRRPPGPAVTPANGERSGLFLRSARGPFGLLMLKLLSLFSFCGGPLRVSDALKAHFAEPYPFVISFAPIVLLLFGSLALRDGAEDTLDRWSINAGRAGSVLLLAMDAYAARQLLTGDAGADRGLVALGTLVGFATAILYLFVARGRDGLTA